MNFLDHLPGDELEVGTVNRRLKTEAPQVLFKRVQVFYQQCSDDARFLPVNGFENMEVKGLQGDS